MINPRALWDFDNPQASQAVFEAGLKSVSPEDANLLKTQIARALGLQGRFEEGLALIESIQTESGPVKAWIKLEKGRLFRSSGNLETAIDLFDESVQLCKANHLDALLVDALHMQALMLPPGQQLVATQRAIRFVSESDDPEVRLWLGSLLNNLGMTYVDLGEWELALESFESALKAFEARKAEARILPARYMVGWALRNLGRTVEARNWMLKLRQDLLAANKSDEYVSAELKLLEDFA